jgi:hypothetical protein
MELSWGGWGLTSQALRKRLRALEDKDCEQVELLDLYNNRLEWLPSEIWERFPRLLDLDVSFNQLAFLPSGLGKIQFESLYVAGNTRLPPELARDCVTRQAAAEVVSTAIAANRARDRARAVALMILLANRFDKESVWHAVPVDVARVVARTCQIQLAL